MTDAVLTDPDSLHYERANALSHYQRVKDVLSREDKEDWLEYFAVALEEEIKYAADNRNNPIR